jgi:transposase
LARGLRNLGYSVELYEARALRKFLWVRLNKTDAGDASGFAEAGRLGAATVSKVHLKSLECQCLQARLTIRRSLIRQRIAAMNLLSRQIEHFGGRLRTHGAGTLRRAVDAEIRNIFGRAPNALTLELHRLVKQCESLFAYERAVESELRQFASENDVCRRLMTVPGVGPLCALTFYSAVDDPSRFRRSSDIGSYFGLTPRIHQSGLTSRSGRISKMGNRAVRALLFHAGTQFMRWSPPTSEVRAWAMRLEERRCRRQSRVALARKLATIMLAIWRSGGIYHARHVTVAGG